MNQTNLKKENELTLLEKMFNVMQAIDFVEKDKRNEFHKYNYASEYAIKKAVHEQLVKNRLLFSINMLEHSREGQMTSGKFQYKFTCIDSKESIEGTFFGTGMDSGDKGLYKAVTGAIKYILTSTFLIPTGDDPEGDVKEVKETKIIPTANGKITPKPEEKEWLTDAQCESACKRIAGGEEGLYQKIMTTYSISKKNRDLLLKAETERNLTHA